MAILAKIPYDVDEIVFEAAFGTVDDLDVFDWDAMDTLFEMPHYSNLQIIRFAGVGFKIGSVKIWLEARLLKCAARRILQVG